MTTELEREIAQSKFQVWINKFTIRGAADITDLGIADPTQKGPWIFVDRNKVVDLFLSLHPALQGFRELFAFGDKSLEVNSEAWADEVKKCDVTQLAQQAECEVSKA